MKILTQEDIKECERLSEIAYFKYFVYNAYNRWDTWWCKTKNTNTLEQLKLIFLQQQLEKLK